MSYEHQSMRPRRNRPAAPQRAQAFRSRERDFDHLGEFLNQKIIQKYEQVRYMFSHAIEHLSLAGGVKPARNAFDTSEARRTLKRSFVFIERAMTVYSSAAPATIEVEYNHKSKEDYNYLEEIEAMSRAIKNMEAMRNSNDCNTGSVLISKSCDYLTSKISQNSQVIADSLHELAENESTLAGLAESESDVHRSFDAENHELVSVIKSRIHRDRGRRTAAAD